MLHWSAIRLQSSPNHTPLHQSLKLMQPHFWPLHFTKVTLHHFIPKPMLHRLTHTVMAVILLMAMVWVLAIMVDTTVNT
ncbi:hypothetical protein BLA29_001211, partial [Euroglyphus maynei]